MKREILERSFIFLFCGIISSLRVSALQINEIMPDCGNLSANCEFIELYSESFIDLSKYVLDTQGQRLKLNGSFQGYYILSKSKKAFLERFGIDASEWKGMGLVNGGDKVEIVYNNDTIDSFSYNKADKNNSWQKIGEWQLCKPTPGKENFCGETPSPTAAPAIGQEQKKAEIIKTPLPTPSSEEENEKDDSANTGEDFNEKIIENEGTSLIKSDENGAFLGIIEQELDDDVIHLEGKDIKTIYSSRNENIKNYAIYGFALFCVLLIILLIINRS